MDRLKSGEFGNSAIDARRKQRHFKTAGAIADNRTGDTSRRVRCRDGDAGQRAAARVGHVTGNRSGAALRKCRERHENREQHEKGNETKILRTVHMDSLRVGGWKQV